MRWRPIRQRRRSRPTFADTVCASSWRNLRNVVVRVSSNSIRSRSISRRINNSSRSIRSRRTIFSRDRTLGRHLRRNQRPRSRRVSAVSWYGRDNKLFRLRRRGSRPASVASRRGSCWNRTANRLYFLIFSRWMKDNIGRRCYTKGASYLWLRWCKFMAVWLYMCVCWEIEQKA